MLRADSAIVRVVQSSAAARSGAAAILAARLRATRAAGVQQQRSARLQSWQASAAPAADSRVGIYVLSLQPALRLCGHGDVCFNPEKVGLQEISSSCLVIDSKNDLYGAGAFPQCIRRSVILAQKSCCCRA